MFYHTLGHYAFNAPRSGVLSLHMHGTARPPIVAVMGHIDHGKSSLLDYIRKANVVAGEAGGITQHISAYEAEHEHEGVLRKITFLDTPGHEAFRALRERGAATADVAILVIAAEEGVKPQTVEALNAIVEAKTPYVVAFTKIDKPSADVERAKISALEHGIYLEGLGGDIAYAGVSSKSGQGIPELLDLVLLTADLSELSADASAPAAGFILESSQDAKKGTSATLVIKDGSLAVGDYVVAGDTYAPVRFIENFAGKRVKEAGPSSPVSIAGFTALPPAGTLFESVKNRKEAEAKIEAARNTRTTVTERFDTADGITYLPLVIKADATGSTEAIKHELAKIAHERAAIRILEAGVGTVTEGDVKKAHAAGGTVIAFHVPTDAVAREYAERSGVAIESFTIIYDLGKRVDDLLKERTPHIQVEETIGEAKILKMFGTTSTKSVMGARLLSGTLTLNGLVKLERRGVDLGRGKITNLQQARVDIKEIRGDEQEFGMEIQTKAELMSGDTVIAFRTVEQ